MSELGYEKMRERVVDRFAGQTYGSDGPGGKWSLTGEEMIAAYDALRAGGGNPGVMAALGVGRLSERKADAALQKLRQLGAIRADNGRTWIAQPVDERELNRAVHRG